METAFLISEAVPPRLIITCNPESNLTEVIDLMLGNKIGSIIVTDSSDQTKAVGIISYMDVLRSARTVL